MDEGFIENEQQLVCENLPITKFDKIEDKVNVYLKNNLIAAESGLSILADDDQSVSSGGETLSSVLQKTYLHYENGSTFSE